MPELLIEIHSEEIPARMQARGADDLARLLVAGFDKAGLTGTRARAFATPRRLTVVIDDLPAAQADQREERRGPRVGAPDAAIDGFCAGAGLTRDQLTISETAKGAFYLGVIERKGRPTTEVIAELIPEILWSFPWAKSMRWGGGFKGFASKLTWVRPIKSIIVLFDGQVVPFTIARGDDPGHGLQAGNSTVGHRFMGAERFTVSDFASYEAGLRRAHVILDRAERKRLILEEAERLAAAEGLELIADDDLLDEVAGLVEWPVPLIGRIDDAFMTVPAEVLTVTMRSHQKYFALKDLATGQMAARFLTVANLAAQDGGAAIIAGNERVLRARLSDAKFFWDLDRQTSLESRLPRLANITFHAKLGTVAEKVARVRALAATIAGLIGADPALTDRAALLAKTDLVTGVVGEFPEVQGIMGRYYALHDGEDPAVAEAIAAHWKPQGPADACPTAPVSVAVALADKIDTLVGFFAVGEKPTGSKDPFALRRAALGVIRLILENGLRVKLGLLFTAAGAKGETTAELLDFFADRLKVALKEQGIRHDLLQAVFGLGGQDDLTLLVKRVEALQGFLATEDGVNLLAGVKRASNILRIEEKKDGAAYHGPADRALLAESAEQALGAALDAALPDIHAALQKEDFTATMAALARLRGPIDTFFSVVTVNSDDPALRRNRLHLLAEIRSSLSEIADFSQIEG